MRTPLQPLKPPSGAPPRLSDRPLPAYRHVPGLTPHPVTHPEGHAYGAVEEPISLEGVELPRDWRACEEYLFGVDLFNRAYFWEAHEAWEAVWHAAGSESVVGRFLQGLIQASAALLKRHVGMPGGAHSLCRKSGRNLAPALDRLRSEAEKRFMGIELPSWRRKLVGYLERDGEPFPFLELEGAAHT